VEGCEGEDVGSLIQGDEAVAVDGFEEDYGVAEEGLPEGDDLGSFCLAATSDDEGGIGCESRPELGELLDEVIAALVVDIESGDAEDDERTGGKAECRAGGGAGGGLGGGATTCNTGLSCMLGASGDTCSSTCGTSGASCCGTTNTGTCSAGFLCTGRDLTTTTPGTCAACGGTDQTCCPTAAVFGPAVDGGVSACTAPQDCVIGATSDTCASCGSTGQPCCGTGGGTCTSGLRCSGRSTRTGAPGTCAASTGPGLDGGSPEDAPAPPPGNTIDASTATGG